MIIKVPKPPISFSMAIGNEELMHECDLKHLRMGIARMKYDIETEKEGEKGRVNMGEAKRAGRCPGVVN